MKIVLKVDWLTLTGKSNWGLWGSSGASLMAAQDLAGSLLDRVCEGDAVVRVDRPSPHYTYGFKDVRSGLHVSVGRNLVQQGWMLRAPGSSLNTPARQKRLLMLTAQYGWNCSRLDFAIDVIGSQFRPHDFWTAWKLEHPVKHQKSISLIEGASGDTFYLGSRTSEKMVRVYDKGAEQGTDFDWLRLEMEFKGEAAGRAADAAQYKLENLLFPFMEFFDVHLHPLMTGLSALVEENASDGYWPLAVKPPRARWFETDVISALRKWAAEDKEAALAWLLNAHDEAVMAAEEARRREFEEPIL